MQNPNTEPLRLEEHLVSSGLEEEILQILLVIAQSSKLINSKVLKAGLNDILGATGEKNVQGEEVQKLDEFADSLLRDKFEKKELVGGIASEEMEISILLQKIKIICSCMIPSTDHQTLM